MSTYGVMYGKGPTEEALSVRLSGDPQALRAHEIAKPTQLKQIMVRMLPAMEYHLFDTAARVHF